MVTVKGGIDNYNEQKQLSRGVLRKKGSENMPKCNINKVAKQLY